MSVAIRVSGLKKTFRSGFFRKKTEVLKGVDLEVQTGEIFGFLGPNGSGKTTTIKTLLGLIFPDAGQVEIMGHSSREVKFKEAVGFLPDNPYFYSYLTGEEFLHFYAQLFGIRGVARRAKVDSLLDLVDLTRARKLQLRKYSKGMLQRIGMAQALINDPKLVIMDEPMTGLDPVGRKQIRDIILKLKAEGKTVFFSTHILSDVEMVCDRVAIMVRGEIRGQGLLTDLLQAKVHAVDIEFQNVPADQAARLCEGIGSLAIHGELSFLTLSPGKVNDALNRLLQAQAQIVSVVPHRESLEEVFMSEIR